MVCMFRAFLFLGCILPFFPESFSIASIDPHVRGGGFGIFSGLTVKKIKAIGFARMGLGATRCYCTKRDTKRPRTN